MKSGADLSEEMATTKGVEILIYAATIILALCVTGALALLCSCPVHAQELPTAPVKKTSFVRDRHFLVPFTLQYSTAVADYISSAQTRTRFTVEKDPFFGRHPSTARMVLTDTPVEIGWAYLGFRMSQSQSPIIRHLWWLPSTLSGIGHVYASVNNENICDRACGSPPARPPHGRPKW